MQSNPNISDFECPICLFLMLNPVKTPCNHSFCEECIKDLFDESSNGGILCPLCRFPLENNSLLTPDLTKSNLISSTFPSELSARKKELSSFLSKYISLQIFYGNRHTSLSTSSHNKHEWAAFVRLGGTLDPTMYIDSVIFTLHPTFHKPVVSVNSPPFEVVRLGWGTFEIPIEIKWKKWTGIGSTFVNHELSFRGFGDENKIKVKIEREKIAEFENNSNLG